ncbi:putative ABC transporter [Biscogniauxia marginata]|nr:putative ABC transporter [Biscogniauxia marginata]
MPSKASARARTSHPVLLRCCIHSVFFVLECFAESPEFSTSNKHESPEELHGILSRVLFIWINPIIRHGYKNILVNQDLPPLSRDIKPEVTRKAMLQTWSQRESIRYVVAYPSGAENDHGFWLVISAVTLSNSMYQHSINKSRLVTRSSLVGLIHDKTMKLPSIAYDNGEATTLMSTDADSLDGIAEMVHETWAQIIEVLIGIILLAIEVGWIWPLPLFLIYLCSHMSRFVAKHLQPRQKAWNNATQNRIAATSSVLSAMKVVKMLGYQDSLTWRIQELRELELWEASKLRWIMVYNNASANALGIFSPAVTLAIFAVLSSARGRDLDTETAFTTVAILSMITHPANMIMTIVPRAVAALAGLGRIQAFLLRPSLQASRGTLPRSTSNKLSRNPTSGHLIKPTLAIEIRELRIGHDQPVLENINIEVTASSLPLWSWVGPANRLYCALFLEKWSRPLAQLVCRHDDWHTVLRGLNLSGGQRQRVALARALFARCDILLLDDIFSGLDGETEQTIFDNLFGSTGLIRRMKTTVILVSNACQYFQATDHIVVLGGHEIIDQGNWQDIKVKGASISKFSSSHYIKDNAILQTGDPTLYGYYFGFVSFMNLSLLITSTALCAFFITIPQYWLQLWTEEGGRNTGFYIGGYRFLSTMSWVSINAQMWSIVIRLAPRSGSRLHERLLSIVMSAPLSYFSSTDNGSTLNRFSQDIQLIDKQLPSALQTVVTQIFKLLMQIILLCMAQKWLAVSLPACALLVYAVQKVYLQTSRQLRFLELQSRAGVFSSFLETIEGLETIRSFGWSRAVVQDNILCVDNSQRPEFLLLCLQSWLNVVLDLLAAAIATSVVAIAVASRGHISGTQVGITLNIMLVANTTLLKFVESWTTLETSLGAISRLKMLETMTPLEGGEARTLEPAENWPSRGHVEFKNITASYQPDSVALRNLSLNISAGQKIVICGRTGSGKSTLLLMLLRILELKSGKIELDGIDIKQVRLDVLRQRCFVAVSQDPLLLSNETLRFNLDPGTSVSDETIVDALTKAGLWLHFFAGTTHFEGDTATAIDNLGFREYDILYQKISMFQELSIGQCQLFAVCRALIKVISLRRSGLQPVIVLDEVTSSLDSTTESTIYRITDEEFTRQGYTVIIVAHRLGALKGHTKIGRDAVVLMTDETMSRVCPR